jgi:hypothetical protein
MDNLRIRNMAAAALAESQKGQVGVKGGQWLSSGELKKLGAAGKPDSEVVKRVAAIVKHKQIDDGQGKDW